MHGCTGRCRGWGAITVHGDGVWVHGKVQAGQSAITVHGRAREGACSGPGQRAIRVHGDGARVHRGRCRGPGQSAITVHGDGVRVKGTGAERDNGARGRCTGAR